MRSLAVLAISLLAAFFLFGYRITQVPPGINGDEAGIGYNALLISRNLTDENNNRLPLFIFATGSDWKQPVTVYATAAVFRVLGVSYFNLRLTSVLFALASLILLYLIARLRGGTRFFVPAVVIFLTTPIILIQSHLALENIAPLPFVFAWLWLLLGYEKSKKDRYLVLAGMSLGVGLFSYLGMRIAVPVLVLTTAYYLQKIKAIAHFLAGIMPFFGLLLLANARYPGAFVGNYSASPPNVYEFLLRYLSVFDVSFLFFKGDATAYHSTGLFGMLLLASLPLFLIGVFKILQTRRRFEILILASFFLVPILFGFVPDIYRASRLLVLVPFYTLISTLGLLSLNRQLVGIGLFLLMANYIFFVRDYWFNYAQRVKQVFPVTIDQTYEFRLKK